jgi:hypothetical protein
VPGEFWQHLPPGAPGGLQRLLVCRPEDGDFARLDWLVCDPCRIGVIGKISVDAEYRMTTHQGEGAAAPAADENEAARRAVAAQLSWDDPEEEPGKPCPCGSTSGLHGEDCDCEDDAVLLHTMRIPGSREDVTLWEDHFTCSYSCNSYTEKVTLPDAPWGVREPKVDSQGVPYVRIRIFPGIHHAQEDAPGFIEL